MGRRPPAEAEGQGERRTFVTLPLAQLVPGVTRPAFRKRSPAGADLMSAWASVVGPRLAAETEPRRLTRGQLTIACAGPTAMELQHVTAELMDRINTYAGTRLVDRVRFVQDHVAPPPVALKPRNQVAAEPIQGLPEGNLNDALSSLLATLRSQG